jgi:RES domain-containing protein
LSAKFLAVFRIVTQRRAADAFSGEGARLYGGRWNPKGVPVVYTASTRSLAMLEMLVQDQPLRARYVIVAAHIPLNVRMERISIAVLPDDWSAPGRVDELRAMGAQWISRAKTAVLCVPTAVVPGEYNYLLNPAHADFARISRAAAETLITDRRLVEKLAHRAPRKPKR